MSRNRVLVVDDEPLVLKSVQFALMRSGYEVEVASGALGALDALTRSSFDLVITDWRMPLMNGDQLARTIRLQHPDLPVLLLTGSILDEPPPGFDAVLFKPFSVQDLRNAVAALSDHPRELIGP